MVSGLDHEYRYHLVHCTACEEEFYVKPNYVMSKCEKCNGGVLFLVNKIER